MVIILFINCVYCYCQSSNDWSICPIYFKANSWQTYKSTLASPDIGEEIDFDILLKDVRPSLDCNSAWLTNYFFDNKDKVVIDLLPISSIGTVLAPIDNQIIDTETQLKSFNSGLYKIPDDVDEGKYKIAIEYRSVDSFGDPGSIYFTETNIFVVSVKPTISNIIDNSINHDPNNLQIQWNQVNNVDSYTIWVSEFGTGQEVYLSSTISNASNEFTIPADNLSHSGKYEIQVMASKFGELNYGSDNSITFETRNQVIWNGTSWDNTSGPTVDDDAVIDGNYNTSSHGSIISDNLTVNGNYSLTINEGDHIEVNGTLTHNGANFTVNSGGSLITKGAVTGTNFNFERITTFDSNTGRYSVVGSPISGADFNVLGANAIVYGYDETQAYNVSGNEGLDRFKTPIQLAQTNMQVGEGYFSAKTGDASGLITFSGTPNTGIINVTLNNTDHPSNEDAFEGFNLVSNPYPAAIEFTAFITANSTDIEGAIYIWDDLDSENERGTNADYVVANALGNVDSRQSGLSKWDGNIRSMQGFFVQAKNDGDLQLDFADGMKVSANNNDNGYYRMANEQTSFKLTLESTKGNYAETLIGMNENALLGKDQLDARLFNSAATKIYSLIHREAYAIQGVPKRNYVEIPLGIQSNETTIFTIGINEMQNTMRYNLILKDHLLGRAIDLSVGESHIFTFESGQSNDRFSIVVHNEITTFEEVIEQEWVVYQNESGRVILNNNSNEIIEFIEIFSLTGQRKRLNVEQLNGNEYGSNQVFEQGLFIVRIITESSEWTQKIILR